MRIPASFQVKLEPKDQQSRKVGNGLSAFLSEKGKQLLLVLGEDEKHHTGIEAGNICVGNTVLGQGFDLDRGQEAGEDGEVMVVEVGEDGERGGEFGCEFLEEEVSSALVDGVEVAGG